VRVIPAVDILNGKCVRLVKGDRQRETVFFADPVAAARAWVRDGAGMVHIVDLDGAFAGRPANLEVVTKILTLGVAVEFGGGVRDLEAAEDLVGMGVTRVVIGTAACKDRHFMKEAAERLGEQVVLGLDVRHGRIAVDGWTKSVKTAPLEFARRAEGVGIRRIIYTSVARDGTMSGPDLESATELASALNIPLTVSGGISTLEDIRAVRTLSHLGIDEIIIGRALYEGAFSYEDAVRAAGG
jgi:phosphoribosylformimino-5-aminoimidazole carboxamide ribotide isomerase